MVAKPGAHQLAAGAPRLLERALHPERRELRLRALDQLERRLRDDAERALRAHEQLLQAVARRARPRLHAAALADADDLARRQHDLERDHQLAHVAEPRAEQRPAVGADAPAHQRARVRRRVVGIHDAVRAQQLVQLHHVDAGADRDGALGQVDLEHPVHALDVDQDAVVQRHGAVDQAGAAGARHDRDALAVGELDDLRHLLGGGRAARPPAARAPPSGAPRNMAGVRARLMRAEIEVSTCCGPTISREALEDAVVERRDGGHVSRPRSRRRARPATAGRRRARPAPSGRTPRSRAARPAPTAGAPTTRRPTPAGRRRAAPPGRCGAR